MLSKTYNLTSWSTSYRLWTTYYTSWVYVVGTWIYSIRCGQQLIDCGYTLWVTKCYPQRIRICNPQRISKCTHNVYPRRIFFCYPQRILYVTHNVYPHRNFLCYPQRILYLPTTYTHTVFFFATHNVYQCLHNVYRLHPHRFPTTVTHNVCYPQRIKCYPQRIKTRAGSEILIRCGCNSIRCG